MTIDRHVIENPQSGERIVICQTAAETAGRLLSWELFLAPGGSVPSRHAHPRQEECFTVLAGQMKFRVGRRSLSAGKGETIRVPPGTVHHFANAGQGTAHLMVEIRPALEMDTMLETAAALAREPYGKSRVLSRLLDLALFMHEFERELAAPYLPTAIVRFATGPIARLAGTRRLGDRYRRLRGLNERDRDQKPRQTLQRRAPQRAR